MESRQLWVLGVAIALLNFGIYLANARGISQRLFQNLGLREDVVKIYSQNAGTNNVYAEIKGVWTSGKRSYAVFAYRTFADGKYLIIGNQGNELIVTNGKRVYKTGEQIITSKSKYRSW